MSSFASKSIAPLSVSSSAPIGLALALLLFGCSESTTPLADGGIAFDATGVPDAAIDAAPGSDIGLACRASGDCSSLCIDTYPGGYCSAICTSSADCPTGSSCVSVSRSESYCFDDCDPLAAARECRPGYGCADDPRIGATVCMPGCTDDSDCPGAA
ncbi:MAG: hypothetical protein OEY14_16105, partial [Myxococcales bacterium]|nr:hypothetical protein [Myxococcales bacterium]